MKIKRYLHLGAIVGALPYNIQNGQLVDANPVQGNFNFLVSQINANIPPLITTATSPVVFVAAGSVGGTANAITLTPTPALASYQAGQSYRFVAKAVNTGGVTINVSGLGARTLTMPNGNTFAGGELQIGGTYDIFDNGTQYMLTNAGIGTGLLAYTPALAFGGASTGITYTTQSASVMTLGDWVFVWVLMVLSSKGSSTGLATISLPVKVNATVAGTGLIPMGSILFGNVTFSGVPAIAPYPNTTLANILDTQSGIPQIALTDTAFSNTSTIACQMLYPGSA